jgi:hypothetical protein
MIGGWARFPTQGVGFRAETLIMPVRPAFGGAARCAARARRKGLHKER